MKAGSVSRTALGVAMRRAAHQLLDQPVIFHDPLAVRLVDGLAFPSPPRGRELRAFVAVRSRYAEDCLAAAVAQGVQQYVILGAGLDTFAYRNPYAPGLKVFELDHPGTQAWKRQLLESAGIAIPSSLTFVPADFESASLAQLLAAAPAFDSTRPAFFSLLGVTPYLTASAFQQTAKAVAAMPAGSGIVFDYAVAPHRLSIPDKLKLQLLATRVALAGEPFRLFLDPSSLPGDLHRLGLHIVEDLGAPDLNLRYCNNRSDNLRLRSALGRLLHAKNP